jgi:hypothetical protein
MKYHFVYLTTSEEKILEIDEDLEPPGPGEYVRLNSTHEEHPKLYLVKEVYFAPESQDRTVFYIEVEPV